MLIHLYYCHTVNIIILAMHTIILTTVSKELKMTLGGEFHANKKL